MSQPLPALTELLTAELTEPVEPRIIAMAAAIAALYPGAARSVLFYGSCLRERQLDGLMLDFYLIVSDYRSAYGRSWLAQANRLVPPNVFPFQHGDLAAKYAVLSEADLARECGANAWTPAVFARFSQPARLIWAADESAQRTAIAAVALAAPTLLRLTAATMPAAEAYDPLAIWKKGFSYTYRAEIRAERRSRPDAIVDADPDRYRRIASAAAIPSSAHLPPAARAAAEAAWRRAQRRGRAAQVLRLAKASFTFAGGIDYIAWKINRHAGTDIQVRPWQRRWPLLGALILLPRLLARGAIR